LTGENKIFALLKRKS